MTCQPVLLFKASCRVCQDMVARHERGRGERDVIRSKAGNKVGSVPWIPPLGIRRSHALRGME